MLKAITYFEICHNLLVYFMTLYNGWPCTDKQFLSLDMYNPIRTVQPEMQQKVMKSDNLQYDTVGKWECGMIDPPLSDVSVWYALRPSQQPTLLLNEGIPRALKGKKLHLKIPRVLPSIFEFILVIQIWG